MLPAMLAACVAFGLFGLAGVVNLIAWEERLPAEPSPRKPPAGKFARTPVFEAWQADTGVLLSQTFDTTQPGEQHWVTATIDVSMPATATDDALVVWIQLSCRGPGGKTSMYVAENVTPGDHLVQTPRFIYEAKDPGKHSCRVYLKSNRPRPSSSSPESNVWTAMPSSDLSIGPAIAGAGQAFSPQEPASVITDSPYRAEPLRWTAPKGVDEFVARGDVFLTACTSASGSHDPVIGADACESRYRDRSGSTVKTQLVVQQLRATGSGFCREWRFPDDGRPFELTRDIHHKSLQHEHQVPVSNAAGCSRTFVISVEVQRLDGAGVMVHRQGSLTTATPVR